MSPETIKCLCELNSNNHLQPGESIEKWFKRLTRVAIGIAKHTNSFSETLAILAEDSDWEVRFYVAKNPNSSSETLAILMSDSDWQIRWFVAMNHNTSSESLAILAGDSKKYISSIAQKQLKQRNKVSK